MIKSKFTVLKITPEYVLIRDDFSFDNPTMTVTNDIENVVKSLSKTLGNRRLFAIDTDNRVDEIVVVDGEFSHFETGYQDVEDFDVVFSNSSHYKVELEFLKIMAELSIAYKFSGVMSNNLALIETDVDLEEFKSMYRIEEEN